MEYGSLKIGSARRRAVISDLMLNLAQIPFDHQAAAAAAKIRIELEGRGQTIGPTDLLIAATAVSRGATLATHNVKEFSRVKGLKVEDWTRVLNTSC